MSSYFRTSYSKMRLTFFCIEQTATVPCTVCFSYLLDGRFYLWDFRSFTLKRKPARKHSLIHLPIATGRNEQWQLIATTTLSTVSPVFEEGKAYAKSGTSLPGHLGREPDTGTWHYCQYEQRCAQRSPGHVGITNRATRW